MKVNKFLMLGIAGLAFAACSNDENVTNNGLEGNGSVTVRIVSPMTKTVGDPTTGEDGVDKIAVVPADGKIYVRLTAGSGVQTKDIAEGTEVKFYDVSNPTKVEAWVNNGETEGQGATAITTLQTSYIDTPENIPAYGSTETITLTGSTETVTEGSETTTYEMYEATVTMEIPVARLEVSGIKHATHPVSGDPDEATCKYESLTIDGIYLDKVKTTATGDIEDYHMPAVGTDGEADYIPAPILSDLITAPNNFLATGSVWPAARMPEEGEGDQPIAQSYNYYFYPDASQMPILKIYFANATAVDDSNPVSEPRYAVIKSYNGNENFQFLAGTIYRITDVTLKDGNIIGDEEGNNLYGVDVTVEEAQWDVQTITGEWVEQ